MTPEDINSIERRLDVTLPPTYRLMLLDGVTIGGSDPDIYFLQDPKELLIVNLELRSAPRENAFAGAHWPDTFVCIGVDGCGNYYAIDAGEADGSVRFFDHEADAFETVSGTLHDYFAYLANLFRRVAGLVPFSARNEIPLAQLRGYREAVITRAETPRESVITPISIDEWTACARAESRLTMRNYRVAKNPFTGEKLQFESPGLATAFIDGDEVEFHYALGRIIVRNPTDSALDMMRQIATSLQARVIKD